MEFLRALPSLSMGVKAGQKLADVAETLSAHEISSAPVTDDQGRCIGILSAADFLKRLGAGGSAASETENVSSYMTPAVQSIASDAGLLTAARIMCAEHIHHLPVIDPNEKMVGVVSTMDVVAAVVNAVDELEASQTG